MSGDYSGDNSVAMKMNRAYQRLLVSILDKSPDWVVNTFYAECQGWASPRLLDLDAIKKEAKENHIIVFHGGHKGAIPKDSYFAKSIMYGNRKNKEDDKK